MKLQAPRASVHTPHTSTCLYTCVSACAHQHACNAHVCIHAAHKTLHKKIQTRSSFVYKRLQLLKVKTQGERHRQFYRMRKAPSRKVGGGREGWEEGRNLERQTP